MSQKRTFAIGDIHGGLRALHQLLERINPQDEDTFIFLGDYVDGWSESAQVIDFLIDFNQLYQTIFIKGNHDIWIQEWLKTGFLHKNWSEESGGTATIKSYQGVNTKIKWKHADFLQNTKPYYLDEQQRLFVHAGFTAASGVTNEHTMKAISAMIEHFGKWSLLWTKVCYLILLFILIV
jgi:serine/threonine protein phosphatase 1